MYDKIFKTDRFSFNIDEVIGIVKRAGNEILDIYSKDFEVRLKDDKSPITKADEVSHNIIIEGLTTLNLKPSLPILSEEGKDISYNKRRSWEYFWLIDPLDGTKEFIKRNGEFTVNIALIYKNEPIFGIVYSPVIDLLYFTDNKSAYKIRKNKIYKLPCIQSSSANIFTIVVSKSHLNDETRKFIKELEYIIQHLSSNIEHLSPDITDVSCLKPQVRFISVGSSLKICFVAEGKANIYPRLAYTMEWDTAAADAILRKTGKMIYKYEKDILYKLLNMDDDLKTQIFNIKRLGSNVYSKLEYNKENLLNPWFIAM